MFKAQAKRTNKSDLHNNCDRTVYRKCRMAGRVMTFFQMAAMWRDDYRAIKSVLTKLIIPTYGQLSPKRYSSVRRHINHPSEKPYVCSELSNLLLLIYQYYNQQRWPSPSHKLKSFYDMNKSYLVQSLHGVS